MILAEVHTDDNKHSAFFDATPFFERATLDAIIGLKAIAWGGGHQSDAVALFMLERDVEVNKVFRYLDENATRSNGLPGGFECLVCEEDVVCWVRANRPTWLPRIWGEILDLASLGLPGGHEVSTPEEYARQVCRLLFTLQRMNQRQVAYA